jgi:hypothetical protein
MVPDGKGQGNNGGYRHQHVNYPVLPGLYFIPVHSSDGIASLIPAA